MRCAISQQAALPIKTGSGGGKGSTKGMGRSPRSLARTLPATPLPPDRLTHDRFRFSSPLWNLGDVFKDETSGRGSSAAPPPAKLGARTRSAPSHAREPPTHYSTGSLLLQSAPSSVASFSLGRTNPHPVLPKNI